jgi:hypothetical protein
MALKSAILRLGVLLVVVTILLSDAAESAAVKSARARRSVDVVTKGNKLRALAKNKDKLEERIAKKAFLEKLQKKSIVKASQRVGRDYSDEDNGGPDYPRFAREYGDEDNNIDYKLRSREYGDEDNNIDYKRRAREYDDEYHPDGEYKV